MAYKSLSNQPLPIGALNQMPVAPEKNFEGSLKEAVFRQENAPVNFLTSAVDEISRGLQIPNENFDLRKAMQDNEQVVKDDPTYFDGVRSQGEFDYVLGTLKSRQADEKRIAASGLAGMAAAVGAGMLSPTVLIPVIGGYGTTAKVTSLVTGAVMGAVIDESILQKANKSRSDDMMIMAVGGSLVIGGLLGGAVRYIERSAIQRSISDLRTGQGIPPDVGLTPAQYEQIARQSPGLSAQTVAGVSMDAPVWRQTALGRKLGFFSPPNNIQEAAQDDYGLSSAAQASSNISNGGVRKAPGVDRGSKFETLQPIAMGGEVEHLVNYQTQNRMTEMTELFSTHWADYLADGAPTTMLSRAFNDARSTAGRMPGKLNAGEFNAEVHRAMNFGDKSEIPQAQAIAEGLRPMYDSLVREMQDVRLLPQELTEAMLRGRQSYLTDVYDHEAIIRGGSDFETMLVNNGQLKLTEEMQKQWEAVKLAIKEDAQKLSDISLDPNSAQLTRSKLKGDIDAMSASPRAQAVEDIRLLRAEVAALKDRQTAVRDKSPASPEVRALMDSGDDLLTRLRDESGALAELKRIRKDGTVLEGVDTLAVVRAGTSDKAKALTAQINSPEGQDIVNKLADMAEGGPIDWQELNDVIAPFPAQVRQDLFAYLVGSEGYPKARTTMSPDEMPQDLIRGAMTKDLAEKELRAGMAKAEREAEIAVEDLMGATRRMQAIQDGNYGDGTKTLGQKLDDAVRELKEARAVNPDAKAFQKEKAALTRRLKNLNQSVFALQDQQAKLIDRADQEWNTGLNALSSMITKVAALRGRLDGMTDEIFDAELGSLIKQIDEIDKLFAKGDATIDKLVAKYPELAEAPTDFERRVQRFREAIFVGLKQPDVDNVPGRSLNTKGKNNVNMLSITSEADKSLVLKTIDDFLARPEPFTTAKDGTQTRNGKGFLDSETPITPAMRKSIKVFRDEVSALKWSDAAKLGAAEKRFDRQMGLQENRSVKLANKLSALRAAKEFDREGARVLIDELIYDSISRTQLVAAKRAAREGKLRANAARIGMEDIPRVDAIKAVLEEAPVRRRADFEDKLQRAGAGHIDVDAGIYDFSAVLQETAMGVRQKILGTDVRAAGIDIARERGPALARMLDIPYDEKVKYLVTDVNAISKAWVKTVVADVELTRRFGDPNLAQWIGTEGKPGKVDEEAMEFRRYIDEDKDRFGNDLATPRTPEQKEARQVLLEKNRNEALRLLKVQIDRVRHVDGAPDNANGLAYRSTKTMLAAHVPILMGNVAFSSLSDIFRPVMKFGLGNTFRDSWIPMITDFKAWAGEMSDIAKAAGGVQEQTNSSRFMMFADIVETHQRRTRFESLVEYAATTMGRLSLSDYWTNLGQRGAGAVANGEFMRALETVITGSKHMDPTEARLVIANAGLNGEMAERMWRMIQNTGAERFRHGTLNPKVDEWTDESLRRAYLSHIAKEIDSTIVMPGQERPAFSTSNIGWRVVNQFRSFGWSSNTKMMAAGLQRRDMGVLNGALGMLAMGAVSYFFWAAQHGTDSKQFKEMQEADWRKWADEAIYRSGIMASFQELQGLLSDFEATHGMVNFSEQGTARLRNRDFRETLLGVSMGTAQNLQNVLAGIDDPTMSTAHSLRKLMFYQNLWYTRALFTHITEATGLPESRD